FDGSVVVERRTAELRDAAQAELDDVLALGRALEAVDVLKSRLPAAQGERSRRIESGDQTVVGVNAFTDAAPSPLGGEGAILTVDPGVGEALAGEVRAGRAGRDPRAVDAARAELRRVAGRRENVMPATLAL